MIVQGRDYEHTLAFDEAARPALTYRPGDPAQIARQVLSGAAFDAAEFSMSAVMILADQGRLSVVPIPVFPARAFIHSYLFVRGNSALRDLRDIAGRRIGLRDFGSTGAIWFRGLLADSGIDWRRIEWVTTGARFAPPQGAHVSSASGDLEEMLLDGAIDLFFSARVKDASRPASERRLRSLIADTRAAERTYAREQALFPIIHTVVLSQSCAASPDASRAVFDAYDQAKRAALRRRLGASFMPWTDAVWAEALDLFGGDPFPYGLTDANRRTLSVLGRYLEEQELVSAAPDLDAIFRPVSASRASAQ